MRFLSVWNNEVIYSPISAPVESIREARSIKFTALALLVLYTPHSLLVIKIPHPPTWKTNNWHFLSIPFSHEIKG